MKQWIWEHSSGTTVSVENTIPVITTVLMLRGNIFLYELYDVEQCHVDDTSLKIFIC